MSHDDDMPIPSVYLLLRQNMRVADKTHDRHVTTTDDAQDAATKHAYLQDIADKTRLFNADAVTLSRLRLSTRLTYAAPPRVLPRRCSLLC